MPEPLEILDIAKELNVFGEYIHLCRDLSVRQSCINKMNFFAKSNGLTKA